MIQPILLLSILGVPALQGTVAPRPPDLRPVVRIETIRVETFDYGNGFFISASGTILTSYHVIREALEIEVSGQHVPPHRAVIVEAIAPRIDLALLRLEGMPDGRSTPFYEIDRTSLASDKVDLIKAGLSKTLWLVSVPEGDDEGVPTTVESLKLGTTPAGTIRGPRNVRVFHPDAAGTSLLRLNLTSYKGMSGSPVLLKNKVLGVFSGDRNPGTGFGWAVPAVMLDGITGDNPYGGSTWSRPRKEPRMVASWPEQGLIDPIWARSQPQIRLLRLDAPRDRERARRFLATLDRLEESFDRFDFFIVRLESKVAGTLDALDQTSRATSRSQKRQVLRRVFEGATELQDLLLAAIDGRSERSGILASIHRLRVDLKPAIRKRIVQLESDLLFAGIPEDHYLSSRSKEIRTLCDQEVGFREVFKVVEQRIQRGFEELDRALAERNPKDGSEDEATLRGRLHNLVDALNWLESATELSTADSSELPESFKGARRSQLRRLQRFRDVVVELTEGH